MKLAMIIISRSYIFIIVLYEIKSLFTSTYFMNIDYVNIISVRIRKETNVLQERIK